MSEFFSRQKEERVEEVHILGEEIPPGHVCRIKPILGVTEVHRLTQPVVLACNFERENI